MDARKAALSVVDRLFAPPPAPSSTNAAPPKKLQAILHEKPVLKAVQAVAAVTLSGNKPAKPNATAKELKKAGILPVNAKGVIGRTDAHRGLKPVKVDGAVVVDGNVTEKSTGTDLLASSTAGKKRKRSEMTGAGSSGPADAVAIASLTADPDAPVLRYAAEAGIDVAAVTDARRNCGSGGPAAKRRKKEEQAEGGQEGAAAAPPAVPLPAPHLTAPVAKALANAAPLLGGSGGLLGDKGATAPKLFDESRRGNNKAGDGNNNNSRVSKSGAKWFNLQGTELTNEVKRDLLLLRHRGYLDPKRHYKGNGLDSNDKSPMALPQFFQMGTVVEAAHERLSSNAKLSKKERKSTLVEAMLADERIRQYTKKNYLEVTAAASAGGKHQYRQKKAMMAPRAMQGAAYDRAFTKSRKKKGF